MHLPKVVLFDMDNTVLRCNEAYFEAKDSLARFICERFPFFSEEEVKARFDANHGVTLRSGNVATDAYPNDMVKTFLQFCEESKKSHTEDECGLVREIGEGVYRFTYDPYPGALEMLQEYKDAGFRLGLCTKGVPEVQIPKIERWNLQELFHDITITTKKDANALLSLAHSIAPEGYSEAWMVGDSLRDDIESGINAGMKTAMVSVKKGSIYDDGCEVHPDHLLTVVTELPSVLTYSATKKQKVQR